MCSAEVRVDALLFRAWDNSSYSQIFCKYSACPLFCFKNSKHKAEYDFIKATEEINLKIKIIDIETIFVFTIKLL